MSAERLAVRDATANDLPALRSLYLRARQDAFTWLETGNYTLHDFDADTAGEQIRVAASDAGTVLGFSSLWRQDLFIHHLYVLPGHERRGVGRALIDDLRNRYGSADLALKCQSRNTRALAFYHALGFEPVESATGPDGPYHLLRLPHTRPAR
ncbi:MAG: GNAT family N-acetyltransferase [Pseudomonadales bacterium]